MIHEENGSRRIWYRLNVEWEISMSKKKNSRANAYGKKRNRSHKEGANFKEW